MSSPSFAIIEKMKIIVMLNVKKPSISAPYMLLIINVRMYPNPSPIIFRINESELFERISFRFASERILLTLFVICFFTTYYFS